DPKIVVGYSDATAILLALYAKTGVPTFYGPALVASLGEFPPLVEETFGLLQHWRWGSRRIHTPCGCPRIGAMNVCRGRARIGPRRCKPTSGAAFNLAALRAA
ncbi:hypothetical protein C3F00_047000, partial [Pseudomonas sp. MWU13-2860]